MKFKDMNLLELAKFWNKDMEKESPELDNTDTMYLWKEAVRATTHESTELEILQALHLFKEADYVEEIFNLRRDFLECFANTLLEEVKELRTSVEVLLKQHESTPANITVGQLSRLKGGVR